MEASFDFRNLFVLDLANNHQGSVEHGVGGHPPACGSGAQAWRAGGHQISVPRPRYLRPPGPCAREHDTSTSPASFRRALSRARTSNACSTRLSGKGCTRCARPSTRHSAQLIAEMGFDLIKVASCSAKDWPLIEAVAETNLPVVFSTGGLEINDVDNLVVFGEHRALIWR